MECIADCEEVGCHDGCMHYMENPKYPGGTKKEEEGQGSSGARPYVLIATNFWFQSSSVAENFVYDNSKSQEINKND